MSETLWHLVEGSGPIVATAIHDGHELRSDVAERIVLAEANRLREEDPHTGAWAAVAPTRVIPRRSRFEVDLNRPREKAVYAKPEDAWGLELWEQPLPDDLIEESLREYDAFYALMERIVSELVGRHGRVVVLDLHTYNHRREGPGGPPADPQLNPDVNVGTGSVDRALWGSLIDRFMADLRGFDFPGRELDVRENVKFRGGNMSGWINDRFRGQACALAIEFKKFFMDEWTGELDKLTHEHIHSALLTTLPGLSSELGQLHAGRA